MRKILIASAMVMATSQAMAIESLRACGNEGQGVNSVVSIVFDGEPRLANLSKYGQFRQVGDNYLLVYDYHGRPKTNLLAVSVKPLRLLSEVEASLLAQEQSLAVREQEWTICK